MKLEHLGLAFHSEYFYVQKESIVEKITFNNRTFYSKFEQYPMPIESNLFAKHHRGELTLAIPLIEENTTDYIVIEYQQDDWQMFYSLLKHLLKSLNIENFLAYRDEKKELFQLFVPLNNLSLDLTYDKVESIKHLLELKSKQSYKIYPNKNLPINLNIITLPTQKV